MTIEKKPAEKRGPGNPAWVKGGKSPNPGGRPKALVEIEQMLDAEHRNVANLREVFAKIRSVAMGVERGIFYKGEQVATEIEYSDGWMNLYLNRILGPVRELLTDEELRDAPKEVIEWLRRKA